MSALTQRLEKQENIKEARMWVSPQNAGDIRIYIKGRAIGQAAWRHVSIMWKASEPDKLDISCETMNCAMSKFYDVAFSKKIVRMINDSDEVGNKAVGRIQQQRDEDVSTFESWYVRDCERQGEEVSFAKMFKESSDIDIAVVIRSEPDFQHITDRDGMIARARAKHGN